MSPFAGLDAHARRLAGSTIGAQVAADPARATDFALRVGPLYASFARQRYDRAALEALYAMAEQAGLAGAIRRLLDGGVVNPTENRAALHTALRGGGDAVRAQRGQAEAARARMRELADAVRASGVTDVVSIGIGGSDLGPRLAVDALAPVDGGLRVHFLSSIDGVEVRRVLAPLDPARTAAIVISKSFHTQETLLNGRAVREWLGEGGCGRMYAVTAEAARALEFGIPEARTLPMWDWVGGRYSLWSAVGFPVALAIGMAGFEALLAGAAEMDGHLADAPLRANLPVLHALTEVWNRNGLGAATHVVVPYDQRLRLLPAYLQQLLMESLGKSARIAGDGHDAHTVPVWWGGVGSDSQHSFFQALHQGTQAIPADFIGVTRAARGDANHDVLLANLLAQAEALANGRPSGDPHRHYPGDRPSTLLLLDELTPRSLGLLLALYEHSTYLQAVLWGINAFDQFGVELGKQVADTLLPAVRGEAEADDPVTRELLREMRVRR